MKKTIAILMAGLSIGFASAANWTYTAFDAASYKPSKDAIKGVEGGGSWLDGDGKTYSEIYSDRSLSFEFPAEADIRGITLVSKWGDSGRVDFAVSEVWVKRTGDKDLVKLDVLAPMVYTNTTANGAKAEVNAKTGFLAKNVNTVKFAFSKLENGFIGLAEVEFRGTMKPVVAKKKEKAGGGGESRAQVSTPAPKPAVSKVVRPKIKLEKGAWCYDPEAKVLTDGTWTFAAEAQGSKLNVGKVQGWPKAVTKLDLSTQVLDVYGEKMTIVRLDTRFGRTGPDVEWRKIGDVAAGFVGALTLPGEGLEVIGDMAFCGCTNATGKIVFAKTLRKLENAAFGTSPKLTFEDCPLPKGVERLGSGVFENDHLPAAMSFPYLKVIGGAAFKNSDVKSLSFGKDLKKVESGWGSGPFVDCRELTTITFDRDAHAEMVGDWAFGDCPKLEALDLSMFDRISDGAPFQRCRSLRSVTLGKNLGRIPTNIFRDVHNIAAVHVFGAPGELPKPAMPPVSRDLFGKPDPRNTMTTFVHLDPKSPTYAADLAAWGKCTAGGELKTTGSTWSEDYAGKDFKDRPLILWQKPFTISISETVDASELNGTYGWFTISRGDDDPIDCTVPVLFEVGGTAKPGQTYCSLWGDVDIPAGEKSVKVKIRPLNDPKTAKDATVTLTLKPHRYALGKRSKTTVVVKNGATYGGYLHADAGKWNLLCHMGNNGTRKFKGNTVAAADWAVNHGFPFEDDIQFSKNGILYLDHDARDREYPADWPDTFEKTLKCIPKGAIYKVDAKCGIKGLPAMIAAVKADKTCDRALLAFNAWDKPFADMVHAELPKAQFWYPIMCYGKKEYDIQKEADHIIAACRHMGAEGISMWWVPEVCTDELFAHIAAAGITIDIWTIDDVRQIKEAVNRGARYITTNSAVPMLKKLPWAAEPVLEGRKPVPPARTNIISK